VEEKLEEWVVVFVVVVFVVEALSVVVVVFVQVDGQELAEGLGED
jgi:hypothetical protein